MEKFSEDTHVVEEQWRTLRAKHATSLGRMHNVLQHSDVVFWEPPRRVGVKKHRGWLGTAVNVCNARRRNLKTILGVRDADICQ
eukprot:10256268-Lingulodinium_polyedra.AAC.1